MEVPEAKEYLAIMVDSAGRVLLRSNPGSVGGYFIRIEPRGDKTPCGAIIDSVLEESGLKVKVTSVGTGVYFGGNGACGYFVVELIDPDDLVKVEVFSVNWCTIEEAYSLISNLKNDADFELEMAALGVAKNIINESVILIDDRLKILVGTAELEGLKKLCHLVERTLSYGENASVGLGVNSAFIMKMIAGVKHEFTSRMIVSEYIESLISKSVKKVGSSAHEGILAKLISVFLTEAYSSLIKGDVIGYKKSHKRTLEYLKGYCELYPEESRARRERGVKGGSGKAEKRKGRDETVRKIIIDTLQKNTPFRVARKPRLIAEKVVDEVLSGLREKGVECERGDMFGLILDMLVNDVAVKKIVEVV